MKTSSRTAIAVVTLALVLALHSCSDYFLFKEPPPQQEVAVTPDPPLTPDPLITPSIKLTVNFYDVSGTPIMSIPLIPPIPPRGSDFVTKPDNVDYQDVVTMTVTKEVDGDSVAITGPVTWTVASEINNGEDHYGNAGNIKPPTDPPNNPPLHTLTTRDNGTDYGVWQRPLAHKAGLAWLAAPTDSVGGSHPAPSPDWSANGDNILNIPGETSAPTSTTVYLADIVGSRTIKVRATEGGATSDEAVFIFGDGPLSVFTKTSGSSAMQWGNTNTADFTNASTQFPAAIFCGGDIKNTTVRATGTGATNITGFSGDGSWSVGHEHWWNTQQQTFSYATKSKLPEAKQLFAVAGYNASYDSTVRRKGAALAANWDLFGPYWSGDMRYNGGDYHVLSILLGNGDAMRPLLGELSRVARVR